MSLFEHPEAQDVLETVFSNVIGESDRGAVLVSADFVDSQLTDLFKKRASKSVSTSTFRRVLSYPGPLSAFGAKADVARVVGLIDKPLHRSINILRRIRNDAAHSQKIFDLSEHESRLREVLKLGPDIPSHLNERAAEILVHDVVERAWANQKQKEPEYTLFDSKEEVLEFVFENDKILETLRDKHPRTVLALGVALICALIIHHRDSQ